MNAKVIGLKMGGMATSLTPIAIWLGVNWQKYAPTTEESIKLGTGVIIAIAVSVIVALSKMDTKTSGGKKLMIGLAIACGLSWLLKSILVDVEWVTAMALAGVMADELIFAKRIEQAESDEKYVMEQTSKQRYESKQAKKEAKAKAKLKQIKDAYNI